MVVDRFQLIATESDVVACDLAAFGFLDAVVVRIVLIADAGSVVGFGFEPVEWVGLMPRAKQKFITEMLEALIKQQQVAQG